MKIFFTLGMGIAFYLAADVPLNANTDREVRNLHLPHIPGELLIKYNDDQLNQLQQAMAVQAFGGEIKHRFRASGAILAAFPDSPNGPEFYELATRIANQDNVEYVEANSILRAFETPNDPKFSALWGLHNLGQTEGREDADMDAVEAWDQTTGSQDVVVAIVDTGVNYAHPDISPNYWTNPAESGEDAEGRDKRTNGIDDDGNGYVDDWRGWDFVNNDNDPMDDNSSMHGSHCAGTIGAAGNDGFGIVGVAWNVSLVGIKFLSASGSGSLANAVKSIEYANTLAIDIQSNSWGGGGYSQVLFDAIQEAKMKDVLFVAAAGNSADDTDANPHFPSSYENTNVLSVAATDHNDELASFSNWGAASVDVAAPGVDILSCGEDDTFRSLSGTSMATPHVAGLAALVKAKYPEATYDVIMARIMNGVDRIDQLRGKVLSGGRVNAANALEDDTTPPGMVTGIVVSDQQIDSVQIAWNITGDDGEAGAASTYEIRYSADPILTEDHWNKAAVPVIQHGGTASAPTMRLSGFPLNFHGFFVMRALDNVGNSGPLTEPIMFSVAPVSVLFEHDGETLDGVMVEDKWGLEELEGIDGSMFSDSPGGVYANDSNFSMEFEEMDFGRNEVILVYRTMTDIERGYDFGFVEVSTDGGESWQEVEKLTGKKNWHTRMHGLADILGENTSFKLRFRLQTDYVVEADGWFIDDVQLISASL